MLKGVPRAQPHPERRRQVGDPAHHQIELALEVRSEHESEQTPAHKGRITAILDGSVHGRHDHHVGLELADELHQLFRPGSDALRIPSRREDLRPKDTEHASLLHPHAHDHHRLRVALLLEVQRVVQRVGLAVESMGREPARQIEPRVRKQLPLELAARQPLITVADRSRARLSPDVTRHGGVLAAMVMHAELEVLLARTPRSRGLDHHEVAPTTRDEDTHVAPRVCATVVTVTTGRGRFCPGLLQEGKL